MLIATPRADCCVFRVTRGNILLYHWDEQKDPPCFVEYERSSLFLLYALDDGGSGLTLTTPLSFGYPETNARHTDKTCNTQTNTKHTNADIARMDTRMDTRKNPPKKTKPRHHSPGKVDLSTNLVEFTADEKQICPGRDKIRQL